MKASKGSQRAAVGLGALVAMLLASGTAAARSVGSSDAPSGQHLVVGAAAPGAVAVDEALTLEPPAPPPAPETAPPTTPPGPTTVASTATTAPAASTTITTAPPRPTTTTRAPSTTRTTAPSTTAAAGAPRSSLWPTSGPPLTQITITGGGCLPGEAGIAVELRDPAGQGISGDGGLASPDGSWSSSITIPQDSPPGRYTVHPVCLRVNSSDVLATYPPLQLTVTS